MNTRPHAFSLIELSIVLVILGLLTGGILSGQSLIRAAELRSVSADVQRYTAAIYSFRDKYFALPGDMPTAIKFWGTAGGGTADGKDATCAALTTASTDAKTCNGDGSGHIEDSTYEMFRAWQHLANAGLIEGSYSGVAATGLADHHVIGVNSPRSKISNGGFGISYLGTYGGDGATYATTYNDLIWFGAVSTERPQDNILKPEEAWNIDTKLDDGKPATGKVIMRGQTYTWGDPQNCTTSASKTDLTGDYRLSNSSIVCALMIRL